MEEVLELPELVAQVFGGLGRTDVAVCACVNKLWRDCAREARKDYLAVVTWGEHRISIYDLEEHTEVWPSHPSLQRFTISALWISHGQILIAVYDGKMHMGKDNHLVTYDPLKERWNETRQIPEEMKSVSSAALWPSTNTLSILDESGNAAIYHFGSGLWTLGAFVPSGRIYLGVGEVEAAKGAGGLRSISTSITSEE